MAPREKRQLNVQISTDAYQALRAKILEAGIE